MMFLSLMLFLFADSFGAMAQSLELKNTDFFHQYHFELLAPYSADEKIYNFSDLSNVQSFDFKKINDGWEGVIEYFGDSTKDTRIGFFKSHDSNSGHDFFLDCECDSGYKCSYCAQFQSKLKNEIVYCGNRTAFTVRMLEGPLLLYCDSLGKFCQEKLLLKGFRSNFSDHIVACDENIAFMNAEHAFTYDRKTKTAKVQIGDNVFELGDGIFYCGKGMLCHQSSEGKVWLAKCDKEVNLEPLFEGLKERIAEVWMEDNMNILFRIKCDVLVYDCSTKKTMYKDSHKNKPLTELYYLLYPWICADSVKVRSCKIDNGSLILFGKKYSLFTSFLKKTVFEHVLCFFGHNIFLEAQNDDRFICFDLYDENFYTVEREPEYDETNLSWINGPVKTLIPQAKIYIYWLKLKQFVSQSKKSLKNYFFNSLINMISALPIQKTQKDLWIKFLKKLM